ncbi:hypothetical protein C7974DRAFT_425293 [Boeremia exigua]|uniref:uncharacterized protein n=1 Tax=Boeremia exigua TaxID=749465 RepID=UPI001E8CE58A|nr:uncharacterized protein C7974DRAFT_425293 [Boeremia exigua]KAH6625665.1 hypothetical protein C7974DRAFT_425293 [Boeremia exigua]
MRSLLRATIVAFAVASVAYGASPKAGDAKSDAEIHLYPFVTSDCTGQPFTSPYELKEGECINVNQARSLRPRFRFDHQDWLKEVNGLQMHCELETFSDFGCPKQSKIEEHQNGLNGDMPKDINSCLIPKGPKNSFFSAKFVCGEVREPAHLCTKTIEHTIWGIDSTYGAPHHNVHTATYTGSLSILGAQASAAVDKRFDPGHETKGVWMFHPWSRSLLCYLCYPDDEHDYRKIECRAGGAFPVNCGDAPTLGPNGEPLTATSTTTSTATATQKIKLGHRLNTDHVDTDSESDEDVPRLDFEVQQKGSWHTPVKFPHPFIDGREACADAEWEKRGQAGKDHIKIQKVHFCDKKDRPDSQWIGFPAPAVYTVYTTVTTSVPSSTSVRHDQL